MNITCTILSYNHPEITDRCIRSVSQLFASDDILLVHNGSRSDNRELLKLKWPRITHIEMDENRGFAGGANVGLKESFTRGEWCLFVTNDCQLVKRGRLPYKPAFVAPLIHQRRYGRIDSLGGQFFPNKAHLRHLKTPEEFNSIPKSEIYVPGTAFLLHRDIFAKVGPFDESLHTYWEDVEYSQRVNEKKLPIQFTTEFELIHSVGKTCHKNSFYTSYLYHRNRARVSRSKTEWTQAYGLARTQLEFHLFYDYLRYSYKFASRRRWDDVKHLTRAYYGE